MSKKITTFITFDGQAEEAMKLYTSLFKNSKIHDFNRVPGIDGKESILGGSFELDGEMFMCMDVPGGFPLGEGMSLYVECKDQAEVDKLYDGLVANGGEAQPCGWLKDKFGVSWQIIPEVLPKLLYSANRKKAQAAIDVMLKMKKLIIADMQAAYDAA
jgi:predicted 3-demethylubiquinone-9 3-methyltransferase (glyoxalase superfamily)